MAQNIERYNSFHYNVNQGMLQSTVQDIAFDENNFCWISYTNGLQKFDGDHFNSIYTDKDLPEDSDLRFFKMKSGALLFSYQDGISKYDINQDKFIQIFREEETGHQLPRKFIGEVSGIIYFISSNGFISGLDQHTFKRVEYFDSRLPLSEKSFFSNIMVSRNIYNQKVAVTFKSRIYLIDLKSHKLIHAQIFQQPVLYNSVDLVNDHEVVYYTSEENPTLVRYNFNTQNHKIIRSVPFKSSKVFRSVFFNWQGKNILSNFNELYTIDSSFLIESQIVNFQNQPVSGNAVIKDIKEDNYGNLYLLTISQGFIKVIKNNYPVKYFGAPENENNFIISLFIDKEKNRILAGTNGDGILVFDTLQNLVKHLQLHPRIRKSFSPSAIIKHQKEYFLFTFFFNEIWRLDENLNWLSSIPVEKIRPAPQHNIDYFSKVLFHNEYTAIVQSGSSFYKINFKNHTARQYLFSTEEILSALYLKGNIIVHSNDSLYFTDTINFSILKKIPFKNTGGVRCYAADKEGEIYIGGNKGIFKVDETGKLLKHLSKETGLPDDCIYAMAFDMEGGLWCSSNKGIFKIRSNDEILQLTREDGLQENEFNTNVVQVMKDGELYFGGVNGISSFYPNDIANFNEQINLLFTDIKINNQKLEQENPSWNITELKLPYDRNYLSFDFLAMSNSNPLQYIYQYKMEPMDKEWIQNNSLQTVRYQLPPGKYSFKIYAGKSFNKNAAALNQIDIYIKYPFWRTWWFYTIITIGTLSLLAVGFSRYNHQKYLKSLRAFENETRLRQERERISRDLHDNIGAYANAVLYNTELLEKEEKTAEKTSIMRELRFASKDIIASLRETIWALKKENFTAEECFLRVKNFIQPFERYYPKIKFNFAGDASAKKIIPYQKALNIVRVIQEAITNAIKHSEANTISLTSEQIGNTWQITIEDDGRGFDPDQDKDGMGNGLQNMAIRAKDGDFNCTLTSQPGKGTSIIIQIS